MGVFFRCDCCGGEIPEPAVEGRHWLTGDGVPPDRFVWCRLCSRAAFAAVAGKAGRVRRDPAPPSGVRFAPGRAEPAAEETTVLPAPGAAEAAVDQVTAWMPRLSRKRRGRG